MLVGCARWELAVSSTPNTESLIQNGQRLQAIDVFTAVQTTEVNVNALINASYRWTSPVDYWRPVSGTVLPKLPPEQSASAAKSLKRSLTS